MFQSLRPNNQIYILHKGENPSLDTGHVVNVSIPVPKYQVPPIFGQQQEMVVDLVVNVGGQEMTYQKVPATSDIADFGQTGVVISDSREAMNSEVLSYKNKSVETLNSIETHKGIIARCDAILSDLNPEFAERQQQKSEIDAMRSQIAELLKLHKDLMARLDSETKA